MIFRVIIILSILALLIIPGTSTGCNDMAQEDIGMFANGQVPPIDRQIPERTELATFALG